MAFRHVISDSDGKLRRNLGKSIGVPSTEIVVPSPSIFRKGLGQSSPVESIQYVDSPKTSLIRKGLGKNDSIIVTGNRNPIEFQFNNNLTNTGTENWSATYTNPSTVGSVGYSTTAKNGSHSLSLPASPSSCVSLVSPVKDLFDLGTNPFTFECWVNLSTLPGGGSNPTILSKWSGANTCFMGSFTTTGFAWLKNGAVFHSAAITLATGEWHHIAIVRGTNLVIYWDGVAQSSKLDTGAYNNAANSFQIGRNGDAVWQFHGLIDDFRFYQIEKYTANFVPS